MTSFPLDGIRVAEVAGGLASAYCGKLLCDAGADVILIEPRWSHPGDEALAEFLHAGKRSATVDVDRLLGAVDVVIGPRQAPGVVTVVISPFGADGPWADRPANEFTLQGWCGSIGSRGTPERPPVAAGGRLGEWAAGTTAAVAALAALMSARNTGEAQLVDVSMFEVMTTIFNGYRTMAVELAGPAAVPDGPPRYVEVPSVERAADGWVGFCTNSKAQFRAFAEMVDHPEWAEDPVLSRVDERGWHARRLHDEIAAWTGQRPADAIITEAHARGIPAAPVGNGRTTPEFDHVRDRELFVRQPGAPFIRPVVPYRLSDSPTRPPSPAPAPGADSDAVLDLPPRPPAPGGREPLPLAGQRVMDFTSYWAGPYVSQILGFLGADVIKVESTRHPDGTRLTTAYATAGSIPWEVGPLFHGTNTGKRDVTLDLTSTEGRDLARALLDHCDVLVENFSPAVVERFGLLDGAWERNPRLIGLRLPAWGLSGPWRDRPGFAQNMEQATGLAWVTGYPDDGPLVPRGACDPIGGMHAAFAVLCAIWARERDGRGQLVEAPLVDAALNITAQQVVDWSAYGRLWERDGNRGPLGAPQGVYPCAGDDQWMALSVEDDAQWAAACAVLGKEEWRERFATGRARRADHDGLDDGLAVLTAGWKRDELVDALLAAGVPAAAVVSPWEMGTHPQLEARGFFTALEHPVAGRVRYQGFGARWPARRAPLHAGPPPLLGQHNDEVLGGLLGVGADELRRLEDAGVIGTRPAGR